MRLLVAAVVLAACEGREPVRPLKNTGFEAWATPAAPDRWSVAGPMAGAPQRLERGVSFRAEGHGAVAIFQDVDGLPDRAWLDLSAWVRCSAKDTVNITAYAGQDVFESSYHSGSGDWEKLTIAAPLGWQTKHLRVHVWARDGALAEVRDFDVQLTATPWREHLPWLYRGLLGLLVAAFFFHPRTRHALKNRFGAAPTTTSPRPETVFVVLGAVFGLTFLVITPPLQDPDEPAHLKRALQLSDLQLRPVVVDVGTQRLWGAPIPLSFLEAEQALHLHEVAFDWNAKFEIAWILREFRRPLDPARAQFASFGATAMYAPLPYLPQLAGVVLGRIVGAPWVVLLYLARLFNLVAWLLVVRFAIRLTPFGQWGFVALALSPMSVFLAGSPSPDVMTNALSLLCLAMVLSIAGDTGPSISNRRLALMIACFLGLALAKQIYIFSSVAFFIIPWQRLGSKLRYASVFAGIVVGQVIVNFGWWAFAMRGHPYHHDLARPEEQMAYVLADPLRFASIMFNTMVWKAEFYSTSFVGNFAWLSTPLPHWVVYLYFLTIGLVAFFFAGDSVRLRPWHRAGLLLVSVGTWLAIVAYHYLIWNPPGVDNIEGGQGRYLIPIAPLVFIALATPRRKWAGAPGSVRWPLTAALSLFLMVAVVVELRRFYF